MLITGIGSAVALAAVTFVGVLDEALDFGPRGDLPAGEVTVWVADGERPDGVRLLDPDGAEVPLTPVDARTAGDDGRAVTSGGVRWVPGYTATIGRPGEHRVEASGGRAALRGPNQLPSATVRRNGIVLPIALATASVTISIVIAGAVLLLRSTTRRQ